MIEHQCMAILVLAQTTKRSQKDKMHYKSLLMWLIRQQLWFGSGSRSALSAEAGPEKSHRIVKFLSTTQQTMMGKLKFKS